MPTRSAMKGRPEETGSDMVLEVSGMLMVRSLWVVILITEPVDRVRIMVWGGR